MRGIDEGGGAPAPWPPSASRPGRRSARSAAPSPPARALDVGHVHGRAAVDDGLERARRVLARQPFAFGMVDQALDDGRRGEGRERPERMAERKQLGGSTPPEAGTTWRAPAIRCGIAYSRRRATSARRRRWRPRASPRRRRRSRPAPMVIRLRCVIITPHGPAGGAAGVEEPGGVVRAALGDGALSKSDAARAARRSRRIRCRSGAAARPAPPARRRASRRPSAPARCR